MTHIHSFTPIAGQSESRSMMGVKTGRYACSCGVLGRRRGTRLVAIVCQKELASRKHCGADAVYADGNVQHSRCAEHVEKKAA